MARAHLEFPTLAACGLRSHRAALPVSPCRVGMAGSTELYRLVVAAWLARPPHPKFTSRITVDPCYRAAHLHHLPRSLRLAAANRRWPDLQRHASARVTQLRSHVNSQGKARAAH